MKPVVVVGDDGYARAIADFVTAVAARPSLLLSPDDPGLRRRMAAAEWIVEAAGQDPARKRMVLAHGASSGDAIVTSDASVITRAELIAGLPPDFQRRHAVAHFFFPLKHCRLVELVTASAGSRPMDAERVAVLQGWLSAGLGRSVFRLPDYPGFCANRLGLFMIAAALSRAGETGADCAAIDRLAIPALGLARSGLFGTADLIGLPTLAALLSALAQRLPPDDPLQRHGPSALAALGQVEAAGVGRLIDRDRTAGRGFRFAGGPGAAEADARPETVIAALARDRDRYAALVAGQNGIGAEALGGIMRQSYGWDG